MALLFLCGCAAKNTEFKDELSASADDTQTDENLQDTVLEQEPEKMLFDLIPKEDFGGREFVIATTDEAFTDSVENSGIIGQALFNRNRAIEEKFNIKIKAVPVKDTLLQTQLQSPQNPGAFDLIYAPMDTISVCGTNGLLMNIYSVPFFGVEKEYTGGNITKALSQNDTAFGVYGNATYDDRNMWCVFYNKDILQELGYTDIYSLVDNGVWTWEKLLEISNEAVSDLDGNKKMSKKKDRYGYSSLMNTSSFASAVFASFGKTYFSRDDEGFFKMDFAETGEDKYFALLKRICLNDKAKFPGNDPGTEAFDAFSEGRLAFFCEKLSLASSLAYIPANWGILPMPKLSEKQDKYYTLLDGSTHGFAVPQKVSDSALSGKVLDAIYLYDYSFGKEENTVKTAFTYYYLRDSTSSKAISVIKEGKVYDAAFAFGAGMPDFSLASYGLLRSCLENNVSFDKLYTQNEKPFSAFVRSEFVN